MSDLAFLSIAEGARRIAAGTLSPAAWIEALLERIARHDPVLHSFITVRADHARAAARAAERAIAATGWRGALQGVPICLKDAIATAGVRTTAHSRLLVDHVPARSATLVDRLERAGAIVLGKNALYEFCYGGPSFDLPWPPARNPWNLARVAGGSSSGTAAAIAYGLAAGGIGTDTGGSIRQPASFCGLAGLKPTNGLVPLDGVAALSFTLDTAGPLARSAEDCAMLLDALAGTTTTATLGRGVAGLRIGVLRHFHDGEAQASPAVAAAIDAACGVLRGLGATVGGARIASLADLDACGRVIVLAESFAIHEAQLRRDPSVYGRIARHRFALGGFLAAADYAQALRQRERLTAESDRVFADWDLLLTCGETAAAPRFEDAAASFPFTVTPSLRIPFNVTGYPALSVCCGFDGDGMPLGLQIAGPRGADDLVLAAGAAYERATPWRERRPELRPA
ncbi:MAG: amidase [Alphaproteobacteria bacterium]|nr:amidase [Alphaproteobacteria bacterium]